MTLLMGKTAEPHVGKIIEVMETASSVSCVTGLDVSGVGTALLIALAASTMVRSCLSLRSFLKAS